jgi:hypothetical protein
MVAISFYYANAQGSMSGAAAWVIGNGKSKKQSLT